VLEQAAADRLKAERRAAELLEQAEATASEIVETSRREHEEITSSMEEAHRQVDRLSDKVQMATAQGAQAVIDGLRPHVEELRQQYKDLETERRAAVMQVGRVRESLRGWARQIASDGESARSQ
jgi:ribose 1,5-bisphosphokinase PhnN